MAITEHEPHFVLLPFMAQGHIIPMVDLARLLASHHVMVTILTTPHNAHRFKTVITRAAKSGLSIHLLNLKFPCLEAGLPQGCENMDMLPSIDYADKFFAATAMLEDEVKKLLQELNPSPSCLIADACYLWATNVALKMQIPRLLFHGTSCFSLMCIHLLGIYNNFEAVTCDSDYFVLPGMPDRIKITKAQLRGTLSHVTPAWNKIWDEMQESEVEAFGTVANTFEELESEYIQEYRNVKGKKVWCIGPVSLCNKSNLDKVERGNKASIGEHECLKWLNLHVPSSVIYVCLGSASRLSTKQWIELGLGLEASNLPFVWVIRNESEGFQTWLLEERFETRSNGRGLLIHGWAPQVLILSHPSIGGFLTHCGWNSTLEGITAGMPMITWPVFGEQFCNEKLIVEVIKTGIRVGVEMPVVFGEEEKGGAQVRNDEIKRVIDRLMEGGAQGEERRQRARKLGEMATRAVEQGGSSLLNVTLLIQDVIDYSERFKNDATASRP